MKNILAIIFTVTIAFANGLYDDSYLVNNTGSQNESKINKQLLYGDFDKIIRFKPIFFNPSTNHITEKSQDYLNEVIQTYKKYKNKEIVITIIGYTDAVQSKTERLNQSFWFSVDNNDLTVESSKEISLNYANYVHDKFENGNIPNDIIVVEQRGGADNLYSGVSKEGREKNHRAMVSFYIIKDKNADSDNDGIIDSIDKCPGTLQSHSVNSSGCSNVLNITINYKNKSYALNDDSSKELKKLVAFMEKHPEFKVLVYGHTANEGSRLENQLLSEKRALSIRKYLISKKIKSSKISVYGKASKEPIASNKNNEGKKMNRRVEIKLY